INEKSSPLIDRVFDKFCDQNEEAQERDGPFQVSLVFQNQQILRRTVSRMRLQRIPQRVSNCLSPFSSHFTCPQGQHYRVWCWLLVALLLQQGAASLKNLSRLMPVSLRYWTVLRMVKAGYWDASALIDEMALAVFATLPPSPDRTISLIGDKTT